MNLVNVYLDDNGVSHASYWWREYGSAGGDIVEVVTNCSYMPYPLMRTEALRQGIITCVRCLSSPAPNIEWMQKKYRGEV